LIAFGVGDMPTITHQIGYQFIGAPNLLHCDDVGLTLVNPGMHSIFHSGTKSVDIDRGDGDRHIKIVS
jgi:hypothetical protein